LKLDPRRGAGRPVSSRVFRLLTHSWGVGIGVLALAACLTFFFLPDRLGGSPAVEMQLGSWDDVYYATYGVAGAAILAGLLGRRPPLEAFGLCLFIAGLCVNVAALFETLGAIRTICTATGTWFAYVFGAVGRLLIVARIVRERVTLKDLDSMGGAP
jgi:hypothetical protein